MRKFIPVFLFLLFAGSCFACSCRPIPSFYWCYNHFDRIFQGRILSIRKMPEKRSKIVLFKVLDNYKGVMADTVSITTGMGGGDCGLYVDSNDVWIIYSDGGYMGMCSPNFLMERGGIPEERDRFGMYDKMKFTAPLSKMKSETKYVKEYDDQKRLIAEGQITAGHAEDHWSYHLYYPQDTSNSRVFYRNGLKDSVEYQYYPNGKIREERVWKEGKMNGKHVTYYPNGTVDASEFYISGEKDGLYEDFYENGKLKNRTYYSMGKRVKTSIKLRENGDTSWLSSFDNAGNRIKSWIKYESGKLMSTDTCYFVGDEENCDWKDYFKSGKLEKTYSYCYLEKTKPKDHGEAILYYENGNVKEKHYYNRGTPTGTWYFYDEGGKLIRTEEKGKDQ